MTHNEKLKIMDNIIQETLLSDDSIFYKKRWGDKDVGTLHDVDFVTQDDFVKTPLSDRTYQKGKGFTKIVKTKSNPFLIKRRLSDLRKENYGNKNNRPIVLFSDGHEILEKCLWFYEHNILPLAGENNNLAVAESAARSYGVDSIISDVKIIFPFLELLEKKYDLDNIKELTLISDSFDISVIKPLLTKFNSVNLILELPETGAFSQACSECIVDGELVFHPDENSVVEIDNDKLVLSKIINSVTPIIRYNTNIDIKNHNCSCGKKEGFILM